MATFGEIYEPSSRTAWEDWDEDLLIANSSQLRPEKEIETTEIDTLLILEGKYLSDCIKAQHEMELINSIKEVNLKLYKTKTQNNYICVISDYNLVLSSEIVELLKPWIIASKNAIAILTKPIVEYQVPDSMTQDYVIRALYTRKYISKSMSINFPKLEQPNMISGIAAGVITLREVLELPAAAVVCYIQHHNVHELQRLLEKFKVIPHVNIEPSTLLNSNLYI